MPRVRSGVLAAWASAWLAGEVSHDDVVSAVTGDDEPHRVLGLPGAPDPDGTGVPLGWALAAMRERGAGGVLLVLPVPGDPRGLPRHEQFSGAALEAGEAVVTAGLGLVPAVTRHGSAVGSATVYVRWTAYETGPPTPDPLDVREAERDLLTAIRDAAATLSDMDIARSQPPDGLDRVRDQQAPHLPRGCGGPAIRLLAQAERLTEALALADADAPGGALTGWQARAREEALQPLRGAVRRAQLAAYNAVSADRRP